MTRFDYFMSAVFNMLALCPPLLILVLLVGYRPPPSRQVEY